MAQDFYFKLFAREFLTSKEVRDLSLQDQAILLRLWCVCCLDGAIPSDLEELSLVCGVKASLLRSFERSLQRPFERFFQRDATGSLFSPRMERERERNEKVREGASKAGRASALARKAKGQELNERCNDRMNSHSHSHKENKRPRPGGNLNQGMGTEGAGFEIPEPAEGVA